MQINDEWDWLEAPLDSKCLAWARQEHQRSASVLESLPRHQEIKDELQWLTESHAPRPEIYLVHDLFRLRQDASHKYGILEISKRQSGRLVESWETVLDIDNLRQIEEKSWELHNGFGFSSSVLGDRILLYLSKGGSDLHEIRDFDIEKRAFVDGGFHVTADRATATWLDINQLVITHTQYGAPMSSTGWPVASFLWARGTALQDAQRIHAGSTNDALSYVGGMGSDMN